MTAPQIKQIFEYYGRLPQLDKLIDEAGELKEAARDLFFLKRAYQGEDKNERIEKAKIHLAEKIADVRIVCDQLEYGLDMQAECERQRAYKLEQQIKQIKEPIL